MATVKIANGNPGVEYREVPGFPGYVVGNDGSVWSNKQIVNYRKLRPFKSAHNYLEVILYRYGKSTPKLVHVLVLEAFVGPRPPNAVACHNDGDNQNNSLTNLRWDTRKANEADKKKHGRANTGQKHGLAKLKDSVIKTIRRRYRRGDFIQEIARDYGVTIGAIIHVGRLKTWRHVPASQSYVSWVSSLFGNRGERQGHARLSEQAIREIRTLRAKGHTHVTIAKRYGVTRSTIQSICAGRVWGWVKS